jgi:hypothetical protein
MADTKKLGKNTKIIRPTGRDVVSRFPSTTRQFTISELLKLLANADIEMDASGEIAIGSSRFRVNSGLIEFSHNGTGWFILKGEPVVSSKSSDYTILDNDNIDRLLVTTGSSANVVMTLPNPANNSGREIEFIKVDSGTKFVEIAPNGSENIRGLNSSIYAIQEGESIRLYCDGSNWLLLGDPTRKVSALITKSGTPVVARSDGEFISSLTNNSAGDYTINFVTGSFSSNPNMAMMGDQYSHAVYIAAPTNINVRVMTLDSNSETVQDQDMMYVFIGNK